MRAKKHLGQNFLNHPGIIRDIVAAADITETDTIVEIGPGKGALTKELLKYSQKVIAIEKDPDLISRLSEYFSSEIKEGSLSLIEGDALELLPEITKAHKSYKVVANIPYYITSQIIRTFLTVDNQPASVTLTIQKEVAERIVCRDGKESILSLSVKIFGTPHYVRKIPKRYFSPAPDVDSAVIHIDAISRNYLKDVKTEEVFFTLIKVGFAHKRKLLIRNLESLNKRDALERSFEMCGIDHQARAETVLLEKWLCLLSKLPD